MPHFGVVIYLIERNGFISNRTIHFNWQNPKALLYGKKMECHDWKPKVDRSNEF